MGINDESMLNPEQAAKVLGVTSRTLQYWRSSNRGPAYHKFSSKTVRYKYNDLLDFRKKQSHLSN
jgi:DNA-binding transcriptional MerR regulator